MNERISEADRHAQGADGYAFEDYLTDLLGLAPLTDAERGQLAQEGISA